MAKARESGVPEREVWERFFDPDRILDALLCRDIQGDALEFGCGYGTFSIPAARRVSGRLHALDIEPAIVQVTTTRAAANGLKNISAQQRDFVLLGSGLPSQSVRYVMLFNILHLEDPHSLLEETRRVLVPGGHAAVIHWRRDIATPRGPSLEVRPARSTCGQWAEAAGLHVISLPELPNTPWHWGMCLRA